MKLQVYAARAHIGTLEHDRDLQQWAFAYSQAWVAQDDAYPLSPALPLEPDKVAKAQHNRRVRAFLENLLLEGQYKGIRPASS